jgi:hypothetical protein
MDTVVTFVSPTSKYDKRHVKIGWSWQVAFFSWVFGLPLFCRRLPGPGLFVIFLIGLSFFLGPREEYYLHPAMHHTIESLLDTIPPLQWILGLTQLAIGLILAPTANARFARALWSDGYILSETENNLEVIKHAKMVWNLAERPSGNAAATQTVAPTSGAPNPL